MKYIDLLKKIKIYETFASELWESSEISNYIESFTKNHVFKKLNKEDRLEFYKLLENNSTKDAQNFVLERIPRLHEELSVGLAEDLAGLMNKND